MRQLMLPLVDPRCPTCGQDRCDCPRVRASASGDPQAREELRRRRARRSGFSTGRKTPSRGG